jgi:hypothetical protein
MTVAFFLILYFVPTFCAMGKRGAAGIIALNILLGWTVLGWVASLCWALAAPREPGTEPVIGGSAREENPNRLSVYIRPGTDATESWQQIVPGEAARVAKSEDGWDLETEHGFLAKLKTEDSIAVTFRSASFGPPRAKVAKVWPLPDQCALVSIDFG